MPRKCAETPAAGTTDTASAEGCSNMHSPQRVPPTAGSRHPAGAEREKHTAGHARQSGKRAFAKVHRASAGPGTATAPLYTGWALRGPFSAATTGAPLHLRQGI